MKTVDFEQVQKCLVDYLNHAGVHAVPAWEAGVDCDHSVVVVSIAGCKVDSAGMGNYLGEFLDPETGVAEEVYGLRCFLTLGLDVYAPAGGGEASLQKAVSGLLTAMSDRGDQVLQIREFSAGGTLYDVDSGRLTKKVDMKSSLYLYQVEGSGEPFIDFELRGEVKYASSHS